MAMQTVLHLLRASPLVHGGDGDTLRNVSRAWCYDTGMLVGQKVANCKRPSGQTTNWMSNPQT
jgi:hypothetical protein